MTSARASTGPTAMIDTSMSPSSTDVIGRRAAGAGADVDRRAADRSSTCLGAGDATGRLAGGPVVVLPPRLVERRR